METQSSQTRLFAVKTTRGQEKTVVTFISTRMHLKKTSVYSVLVLESLKGYIFVEAINAHVVTDCTTGFKHVKSQIPGIIQHSDIEKFLVPKSVITELDIDDTVEVVAGPFRGMRAKITRIDKAKSEVTIILLEVPYQMPVTVDANYLEIVEKAKSQEDQQE